jgi:hypothetical protein
VPGPFAPPLIVEHRAALHRKPPPAPADPVEDAGAILRAAKTVTFFSGTFLRMTTIYCARGIAQ